MRNSGLESLDMRDISEDKIDHVQRPTAKGSSGNSNGERSNAVSTSTSWLDGKPSGHQITCKAAPGIHLSRLAILIVAFFLLLSLIANSLLLYKTLYSIGALSDEDDSKISLDDILLDDSGVQAVANRRPHDVRLPYTIRPRLYDVKLVPLLWKGNHTFYGTISIQIDVNHTTNNITMHSSQLEINEVSLFRVDDTASDIPPVEINLASIASDKVREFIIIKPEGGNLLVGRYIVNMSFNGKLSDNLQGFYRSSYTIDNTTRWIATTQFQSVYARRVFPCFDEPSFKAIFKISLARPYNLTAISNMPKVSSTHSVEGMEGYVWDHFAPSFPMSTYLVAFTISDFEYLSDSSTNHRSFRVWARSNAIEQARYALNIGPKILTFYEEYFNLSYPLPKTDMIAIPDFAAGAMENWGLITYRETAMLYEKGVSKIKQKERIGKVIAHELAHQWFGNLVTPNWWSDLWLNEGFATYVEHIGLDKVEPSLRALDQFIVNDLQSVLQLDAYKTSHPIFAKVNHPSEIDEIFDFISYEKGASLIRMMEHFLTAPVFRRGLNKYLVDMSFDCATQEDLWSHLTEQAHKYRVFSRDFSVKEIMETWTLKTGYPLITIIRDYDRGSLKITQDRFGYSKVNESNNGSSKWWVPLSHTTQQNLNFNSTSPSMWLKGVTSLIVDRDLSLGPQQWIIFNIQQTGYYRVNYDERNWKMISDYLNDPEMFKNIGELNRAQLLDDCLSLARSGIISYHLALNLTKYLSHETEYIPWVSVLPSFTYIMSMIQRMPIYDKFKIMVEDLAVQDFSNNLGFLAPADDESIGDIKTDPLSIYRRVDSASLACHIGVQTCVQKAISAFQNWRSSPNPDTDNPISPNLRAVVYCTALREGGHSEWQFAWERYIRSNVGSEKTVLLSSLACTRHIWILNRYLYWAVTEKSGIRKQDASTVFSAVANNVIGHSLVFPFLRDNWTTIRDYFGSATFTVTSIIKSATSSMNSEFELRMLKEFVKKNAEDLVNAVATVQQSVELVQVNVQWMKDNYKPISDWLTANY